MKDFKDWTSSEIIEACLDASGNTAKIKQKLFVWIWHKTKGDREEIVRITGRNSEWISTMKSQITAPFREKIQELKKTAENIEKGVDADTLADLEGEIFDLQEQCNKLFPSYKEDKLATTLHMFSHYLR